MRTKEIEEAMELFEKVRVNSGLCAYITKKDVKKAAILSEYIKELENSVSKDKIREGITKVCNRHDYVDNDFIYDLDKELLGESDEK